MYNKARSFAEKNILPENQKIDEEGIFPEKLFESIGENSFFSIIIPKEYGGMGLGLKESMEVIYAFGEASPTVSLCYMMHNAALEALYENDVEELAKEVSADIVRRKVFMTGAHSEFETGVHCISKMNLNDDIAGMTFTGRKNMVTSGKYAYYYLTTTPATVEKQQDYWIFTKDMDGISFDSNQWNGMGMKGNVSAPMNFENVYVDSHYRVGTKALNSTIHFNLGLATVYAAICKRCYDESLNHIKTRKYSDGSALIDFDSVKNHISKIYRLYLSSTSTIKHVIDTYQESPENSLKEALTARILASENAIESTTLGMRVGGGKAYNKESVVEQLHRDSLASQVMTPSIDVLEKLVADML